MLINLERSSARRQTMQARLDTLGLAYEWLPGVDGSARLAELLPSVDQAAFERNVGRTLLPGEIGCYHSHLRAWRRLLDSPDEVLLVLEDDVVFGPDFMQALHLALAHVEEWDFLKLNKIRAKQPITQSRWGGYGLNAYLGPATGLGAYLITRATIERLLPGMLPITRPIDHELDRIHVHDFRHFGMEPFPSYVDDGDVSTITGRSYASVNKFPWYRRLPLYRLRLANLVGKAWYLWRTGRLFPSSKSMS